MNNFTVKEIIKKLNPDIDCKEYTYNLNNNVNKCDEAIKNYISRINKNALKNKDIKTIKDTLKKIILNEDESSRINPLMYFNIKDDKIYIYSFSGFSDNFTASFKKDNTSSFLRFLLDEFFKDSESSMNDKYFNINSYLTIKTRDYIKNIFSTACTEEMERNSDCNKSSIFEEINYISTLPYEGVDICAKLAIMNKALADKLINYYIELDNPILFNEYRKVRKLLQTSDENTYLIGDNEKIYGLGEFKDLNRSHLELDNDIDNIFIFNFTSRFEYKISDLFITNAIVEEQDEIQFTEYLLNEHFLVNINNGQPNLIEDKYSENTLENAIKKVFKGDFKENELDEKIDFLKKVISYAKNQKHGTTVVITTPKIAKTETKKLINQSIKIRGKSLCDCDSLENLVSKITSIDGAIYIDINSYCYAIGVILDGTVDERHGDSSRGSRYNSAIKYSLKREVSNKCIIIVISEDGMVDIIYKGDKYNNLIKQINELYNESNKLYGERNYEGVLNILDQILKLDTSSEKAYCKKGVILSALGRKEEALKYYDLAIKFKPDSLLAYYNKGNALSSIGKKEEAIKCYDAAIKLKPDYVNAYNNKGAALSALGRKEEAIECYDLVIKLKPDLALAYKNKGNALAILGRDSEAEECYTVARELREKLKKK
ncbi:tetratricopeptide repeat protein [Clostridium hydrogenum]|uniref:tetratricopeptide repeat protein n=1 Tax=Clostridium hydrogenum TaxID=2855764 RepID=UPI001F34C6AF|nr:tetratricopeptide repeat protein [Clostridium hydrogenum]